MDDMDFVGMRGRKRIVSACQQCKERKRRCDGGEPRCGYCLKHGKDCVYTVRRRRGPGKNKESSRALEQQRDQGRSSSGSESARVVEDDTSRSHEGVDGDAIVQDFREGQTTPRQDSTGASSQSPCSAGELPLAAKRFTAFINDIRTTTRQMQMETQTQITQSSSEKRTFTRLPPEHLAADLMRPVAEEIQLHGVFLTREEILHRLAGHYSTGLDDPCSDPCRWATLCSFMGISALHRTADGSVAALSSIAWAFFKNAFAMYAELVTQRPEISNCEALLAMALFMLRTADACVAARLAAVVAQSVHMLGLHKYEHYIHLESGVAERQRAIFWVTYIVNADVAHKYDIPSPLDVEDFDLDFPKHQDSGRLDYRDELAPSQQASFLRQRSVLAVMQLRIHRLLQQVLSRNTKRKRFDMQEDVIAINGELETWKYSPPSNIQPGPQPHGSPLLEMPVAVLHYVYFSCICKVSMAVVLLANPVASQPVPEEQPVIDLDASCSDSILAKDMCAMAARGILDVLFRLESQPFTHVWQTLCFPLSAVLILLSGMLTHPASVQAQTDARLIHDFTRYLERLRKEGSDVRDLLDGCTKFHSIATCALEASNTLEQTAEIRLLHSRFTHVTDWLQLAQGLLSNVPVLRNKAREVFCGILESVSTDEAYGAFTPDCLKSSTYNL